MSFLKSIFGKSKRIPKNDKDIGEHLDYLKTLRKSAIALSKSDGEAFSQIGGLPSLPENVAWPKWKGTPLAFLCQFDISELPEECERNGLPTSGVLYFFYDQEQKTWGIDPEDKGSWQVIYTDKPSKELSECPAPEGLSRDCIFPEKPVVFSSVKTYPNWQDDRVDHMNLTNKQGDQYVDLCLDVFRGNPKHHLFGYPSPVQGDDMELECQLASNGVNYDDRNIGNRDLRAKQLETVKSDWILLFQLDTDDDVGMMWGDCGLLYFWIKKTDLKETSFENCWMILQCH